METIDEVFCAVGYIDSLECSDQETKTKSSLMWDESECDDDVQWLVWLNGIKSETKPNLIVFIYFSVNSLCWLNYKL